jgi:hypothetical protein
MVEKLGLPLELINIIRNMYVHSTGVVADSIKGEFFEFIANMGVK